MKNSINKLKGQLTQKEVLSPKDQCAIKGGTGEDLRNKG
jgi:hypothetical protein